MLEAVLEKPKDLVLEVVSKNLLVGAKDSMQLRLMKVTTSSRPLAGQRNRLVSLPVGKVKIYSNMHIG